MTSARLLKIKKSLKESYSCVQITLLCSESKVQSKYRRLCVASNHDWDEQDRCAIEMRIPKHKPKLINNKEIAELN